MRPMTSCGESPRSTTLPRPNCAGRPSPGCFGAVAATLSTCPRWPAVFPGLVTYSASKAALSHFTAGLRADLRGLPIGTTLVELGAVPTDLLAKADNYEPTAKAFQRAYRLRSAVDVSREKVAEEVVKAVYKGRRHVRLPKRSVPFAMLVEVPRRATEILLTGVPHQAK